MKIPPEISPPLSEKKKKSKNDFDVILLFFLDSSAWCFSTFVPEQQSVKKWKWKENIVKKKLVVPQKQNIPEDKERKKKFIQKMKRRIIINKHDNCNQFLNSYDKNRKCWGLIWFAKLELNLFLWKRKEKSTSHKKTKKLKLTSKWICRFFWQKFHWS